MKIFIYIYILIYLYFCSLVIYDFNKRYAKEKKLNIDLKLHLFTEQDTTSGEEFYASTINSILNK